MREITVHSITEEHTVHKAFAEIAKVDARRLRDQHHHLEEKMANLLHKGEHEQEQGETLILPFPRRFSQS